eukprot:1134201-Pelagomonas_calceolata.AAC.7
MKLMWPALVRKGKERKGLHSYCCTLSLTGIKRKAAQFSFKENTWERKNKGKQHAFRLEGLLGRTHDTHVFAPANVKSQLSGYVHVIKSALRFSARAA